MHAVNQHEVLLGYLPWCYPAAGGAQPLLLLSRQATRCHALPALRNEAVAIQGMETNILLLNLVKNRPETAEIVTVFVWQCLRRWVWCCAAVAMLRDAVFLCYVTDLLHCCVATARCCVVVVAVLHNVAAPNMDKTSPQNEKNDATTSAAGFRSMKLRVLLGFVLLGFSIPALMDFESGYS